MTEFTTPNAAQNKCCPKCQKWACDCVSESAEASKAQLEADIKLQVENCLAGKSFIDEDAAASIANTVFTLNFSESVSKELISGIVAKCLLESGLPTAPQITEQIESAIKAADIPDKAYIKSVLDECQRTEDAIKLIIQGELSNAGILDEAHVNGLAKIVLAGCFADLIKDYCTKAEIQSLINAKFGELNNYTESDIRTFSKSEADACIKAYPFESLVNTVLGDSGYQTIEQIKVLAKAETEACISKLDIPTQTLIEAWSKGIAAVCANNAINEALGALYLPTQAEHIALIKTTTFDCLKTLLESQAQTESDGNTRVSGIGLTCDATGLVRFQILQDDNTVEQVEADFSKFLEQAANTVTSFDGVCDASNNLKLSLGQSQGIDLTATISLDKLIPVPEETQELSFCFDYGGAIVRPDSTGKVTFSDNLKCELWTGGYDHVAYDAGSDCRVIKYKGPTQADIESIAQDIFDAQETTTTTSTGITLSDVQSYVSSVSTSLCVSNLSVVTNSTTGEVTVSITDQCGTKSDSFFVGSGDTGIDGITQEQAKIIAQNCVDATVKTIVQACIDDLDILTESDVNQLISDYVTGLIPTDSDINTLIQQYITANQSQFCNTAVGVNYDEDSRELTVTVTDQCGAKSDSVTLPATSTGGGLTEANVESIIDNFDFAERFCNTELQLGLIGSTLQVGVTDDCGTKTASQDLSAIMQSYCINDITFGLSGNTLSISTNQDNCGILADSIVLPTYCITGTTQTQVGQVVTIGIVQENCPTVQEFSFTVNEGSGEGSVECCNTLAVGSVDVVTKTAQIVISQSVGADVTATLDLNPLINALFENEIVDHTDGCSSYRSLKFCGTELGPFPIWEPKQCCVKYCVIYTESTTETITFDTASGYDWTWFNEETGVEGATGTNASGSITQTFTAGAYQFEICQRNACERAQAPTFSTGLPTSKNDCGC